MYEDTARRYDLRESREVTDHEIAKAITAMRRRTVPFRNDRIGEHVANAVYFRWATSLLVSLFYPQAGDSETYWTPIGVIVGLSSNRLNHYAVEIEISKGPLACSKVYGRCSLQFGVNVVVTAIKDALGKHFIPVPNFSTIDDFKRFLSGLGYMVAVGIEPNPEGWVAYKRREAKRAQQAQSAAFGEAAGLPTANPMGIAIRSVTHVDADAAASAQAFEN